MSPDRREWRLRVFKRDGSWRIRISVNGEPWGSVPLLFVSLEDAFAYINSTS